MSFLEEVKDIFSRSHPSIKGKTVDDKAFVCNEIDRVRGFLVNNAKNSINGVRLSPNLHSKVEEYFRNEGFVIWKNDQMVYIKLPESYKR